MSVDRLINLLAAVTLIEMMITIGLAVTVSDVLKVGRNWRLAARAVVANYILLPGTAVGLLFLFYAHPMVATGLLVVAACPGAPYGPPFTAMANGNITLAVSLMVGLAASSAILAPLLLVLLLPIIGGNAGGKLNVFKMVGTLLGAQLLPLCIGLRIRRLRPALADRVARATGILSVMLNLLTFSVILLAQSQMLKQIRLTGCLGMLCVLVAAVAVGRLMAGPVPATAKSFVLTTAVRNVGVGLVIGGGKLSRHPRHPFCNCLRCVSNNCCGFSCSGLGPTCARYSFS